jgi:hypothetical protein
MQMMRIYSAIFDLIWRAWNMFFALFSPCKCLEHPIIFIIFTSIFLIRRWDVIAHDPRLDGSLKLVLLCFCLWLLTRVPFVNCLWWSYDQLILVIVRPGSSVTLSGAHQPLIHSRHRVHDSERPKHLFEQSQNWSWPRLVGSFASPLQLGMEISIRVKVAH